MDTSNRESPLRRYLSALVTYLDTIQYCDKNHSKAERLELLRYVYFHTAEHFAHPPQAQALKVRPKKMEALIRTSVQAVVFCWIKLPSQVMIDFCIFIVYIFILDDDEGEPRMDMSSFAEDLLRGRPQKGTFWRLMNDHLSSSFLPHYGSFCSLAILRSILDYFQGCWIEKLNFGGLPGADYLPLFLRRLNGLGGICGASFFPVARFKEELIMEEITTVIAQIEPVVMFVNDLMSFYKEHDIARDQINLVTNQCRAEGITLDEAFDRLTDQTISAVKHLQALFNVQRCPEVAEIIQAFIHGYTTFHLCDRRYRMQEAYDRAGTTFAEAKFCKYYEAAIHAGSIDLEEWWSITALPTIPKHFQDGIKTAPAAHEDLLCRD